MVERDGQIESFNQALVERDREIAKLKQSNSWRITSPIRVAKNFVINPRRTAYAVLKKVFWRLPASLRQTLYGPRHAFVRFVRGMPSVSLNRDLRAVSDDLSWMEFQEKILSKKEQYKGIFVQEPVIDWNVLLYQRPQHISTALGLLGYLVIYRTDNWADDDINRFRLVARNLWVTNRYEVESIQGAVRSVYSTAYAHTPELIRKNVRSDILVYEYIDHIDYEISGDAENINRLLDLKEFAFSGGADFIVCSSKKLYEEALESVGRDKVILIQNGVDTAHYRNSTHQYTTLPTSLTEFKKKHQAIVGYFGAIAPWLWYKCIGELSLMRPDIGFVFIGPDYYGGASKLPKYANILYLGAVDYKVLPAYAYHFDVCFIPFKPGDISKTTSPLKLYEYFALEKPVVVTTDMDECTFYDEVFSGNSAVELSDAIDQAIMVKDSPSLLARLRVLADQNDWSERALVYETVFSSEKS